MVSWPRQQGATCRTYGRRWEKARAFTGTSGTLAYDAVAHESAVLTRRAICCLKNYGKMQTMAKCEPDSRDVFEEGFLDSHYPNRPKELGNLCLLSFVTNYDWYGRDDEGNRCHCKLTSLDFPITSCLALRKRTKKNYYYSLTLLSALFRKESTLLLKNEIAEQAFSRLLPTSHNCSDYHTKLQKILQVESKVKKITPQKQIC